MRKNKELWEGKGHIHEFDDFKTNGQSATNNPNTSLTDWEATDIVQFADEFSSSDEEFYEMFTMNIFQHFGWKYFGKNKQE